MDLSDFDIDQKELGKLRKDPPLFVEKVLNFGRSKRDESHPFEYQKEFLRSKKRRRVFVAGRQVGKSVTLSWLALWKAVMFPDSVILVFSPSNRQSIEFLNQKLKGEIRQWIDSPKEWGIIHETKSSLHFSNGSRIMALPAANNSNTGETIRGFTVDMIIVDEAAFVDDDFYTSVLAPMLLTTQGDFIIAGTPWGQSGYLYDKFHNERWKRIQVSSFESPIVSAEDLEELREYLSPIELQREILGEFAQKQNAAFEEDIIKKSIYRDYDEEDIDLTEKRRTHPEFNGGRCFLGVDPARYGDDRAVFLSLDDEGNVFDHEMKKFSSLTEVEGKVRNLHAERAYSKILIDETGLGGGPVDSLKEDIRVADGVTFSLERQMSMYQTLRKTMADGEITIPDDRRFIGELRDMEREDTRRGKVKYQAPKGGYDDIPDALALACWAWKGERHVERATEQYTLSGSTTRSSRWSKK